MTSLRFVALRQKTVSLAIKEDETIADEIETHSRGTAPFRTRPDGCHRRTVRHNSSNPVLYPVSTSWTV